MRKARKKAAPRRKPATRRKVVRRVRKGAKAWTSAEVATLRKLYRSMPASKIARMLKRSLASVQAKARTLGLRKAAKRRAPAKRKPARRRVARKKVTRKNMRTKCWISNLQTRTQIL